MTQPTTIHTLVPPHKRMLVSFAINVNNDVAVLYRYLGCGEPDDNNTPFGGARTMSIVLTPEEDASKHTTLELEHGFVKILPIPLSRSLWNALIEIGWKREEV